VKALIYKFFAQLGVWGWTVLVLVPFFFIMLFATKDTTDIYGKPLSLIYKPNWSNFSGAWNAGPDEGTIGVWFINTALLVITALVVSLVVAVPAAYFTIFLSLKQNRAVMITVLSGTVVPTILLVIPYFKAYNQFGLLNKPIATGVAYGVLAIPTTFLLMNRFFLDFPREVLEAGFPFSSHLIVHFPNPDLHYAGGVYMSTSIENFHFFGSNTSRPFHGYHILMIYPVSTSFQFPSLPNFSCSSCLIKSKSYNLDP
jgi:hypothetical protein